MDDFEVTVRTADVLGSSDLVDTLAFQANKFSSFPVVINGVVRTFHNVRGGSIDNDHTLVQLVQRYDHMATPPETATASVYEVQLDDTFLLFVDDVDELSDDEEYVLSLAVTEYTRQDGMVHR